ncbi:MAG: hemolysin family protein [Candidatus Kapaibacterium sp.]|nr:HlyC/CorC family transporter [Ignavibacteriota bacterium]MCB9220413.1 HlyC/CorC family transporter [Ignavibacteria bacterium]
MELLLIYLSIAVFFSFLCSFLEAALLSTTHSFISTELLENRPYAVKLKKFKDEVDKPLTAILTLNTFANTFGAAGVGAQAQNIWGTEYLTAISVALTLIILIVSEIIPKTIGAAYWKQFAPFIAYSLQGMVWILYPFVVLAPFITKRFKVKKEGSEISRYDIHMMTMLGETEGVLDKEESQIIQNLLRFDEITVHDIMTPRTVVVSEDENTTASDFFKNLKFRHFTRIPLYNETVENITGYVIKEDLINDIISKKGKSKLAKYKRPIRFISIDDTLPTAYEQFIHNNEHIAAVYDEYKGFSGILTMEDIIETLLGVEIMDEYDSTEDLQQFARKNWEKRAKKLGIISEDNDKDIIK